MIKQFNLTLKIFDDIHASDEIELSDGWYIVDDDMIDNISASITGGGDVWLDDNGKLTCSGKSPSPLHIWDGSQWVIDQSKETALKAQHIAQLRDKINALRDAKSAGGVYVEQLGKWFDSDSKAQAKLLGLKATMDLVGEITVSWTCADNTDFEEFGKPHLTAVIAAILQAENHNHTVAKQHKAAIELADNPLEYDYSGGWSKTYEDYLAEQANG